MRHRNKNQAEDSFDNSGPVNTNQDSSETPDEFKYVVIYITVTELRTAVTAHKIPSAIPRWVVEGLQLGASSPTDSAQGRALIDVNLQVIIGTLSRCRSNHY